MKPLCLLSLGLLLIAGCADTEEYEVNKPVITDPAPDAPVVHPEDTDTDLDVNVDDNDTLDDTTDDTTPPSNAAPGASDTSSAPSGAIENDDAVDNAGASETPSTNP